MGAKNKNPKLPEGKLLKAMAELSEAVEKSDALADADPEGGLSTEGTPLSNKVKETRKGGASTSSSMSSDDDDVAKASGFSASSMSDSASDDDDSSDDDSSDGPPMMASKKKSKKSKKSVRKAASASSSSSDDASSDDDSDDHPAEKSFRQAVEQDETMIKAIEVADFLEALVDQLSNSLGQVTKSLHRIEQRLNARIDDRIARSVGMQQDFSARLAKAVVAIGTATEETAELVKSFGNAPIAPRGKAVISKSDVHQPPWSGGAQNALGSGGGEFATDLSQVPPEKIGDWLFKKSANNQIDPRLIMAWENDRYDPESLPPEIQKALVNDLCK